MGPLGLVSQDKEVYDGDTDHSNDNKRVASRAIDCGPLFQAPVNPDATGHRVHAIMKHTETIKKVVRRLLTKVHKTT